MEICDAKKSFWIDPINSLRCACIRIQTTSILVQNPLSSGFKSLHIPQIWSCDYKNFFLHHFFDELNGVWRDLRLWLSAQTSRDIFAPRGVLLIVCPKRTVFVCSRSNSHQKMHAGCFPECFISFLDRNKLKIEPHCFLVVILNCYEKSCVASFQLTKQNTRRMISWSLNTLHLKRFLVILMMSGFWMFIFQW